MNAGYREGDTLTLSNSELRFSERPAMERDAFVYALRDHLTEEIFYVGSTLDPLQRLTAHARQHPRYSQWVNHHAEYFFELKVLKVAPFGDIKYLEQQLIIKMLEEGHRLENKAFPFSIKGQEYRLLKICEKYGYTIPNLVSQENRYLPYVWFGYNELHGGVQS